MGNPDKPFSIGCSPSYLSLVSTAITPGGSGWGGSCSLGGLSWDGGILPSFGFMGESLSTQGKLFPAGTTNLPGTSVQGSSIMGHFGLVDAGYKAVEVDRKRIGSLINSESLQIGLSNYSVNDVNWMQLSLRKETSLGVAFNSGRFSVQPFGAFALESVAPLNKPENQSTLRDYGRLMSLRFGVEFAYRDMSLDEKKESPEYPTLRAVNYFYSDIIEGAMEFVNYKSMDRDIDTTKSYLDKAIGSQEPSTQPSATSDVPSLLLANSFFEAKEAAIKRGDFYALKDKRDAIFWYHVGRTAVFGIATAAADRPDVLAPATFSSARHVLDLLAIRGSDTPQAAFGYHLLIGSGMMAVGALANGSPYGKALSQAGMEGIGATAFSPDDFDSKKWIDAKRYEYTPFSYFSRSGGVGDVGGSRGSFRFETTFQNSILYTATTLSSPMIDPRSSSERAGALASNSEGTVKYANTDVDIPTTTFNTFGIRGATGEADAAARVHGNIGGGPQMEFNSSGAEPGIGAEIGAGLDVHIWKSYSLGLTGRCSASVFMNGHATECGVGLDVISDQKE